MNDEATRQEQILTFLGDPASYGGQQVRRIDTHAASVFLTPRRALKVKRAVKFPFLDYSTLAKRKAACEAELAVNRPYAPQLYRGVVAITRGADGALTIGGAGEPVEWAVDMHRFDETQTLDHRAEAIDAALADALGRVVAAAHDKAAPRDAEPWIAALGAMIEEHDADFRAAPDIFPAAAAAQLTEQSRAQYRRVVPLLRRRGQQGLVRHIHGDLHLGNIALIAGRPVLFDAIEFSEIIATGDVFYDLAFLLMDLLERGFAPAANTVFNRYLAATQRDGDLDALTTLPFFLSLRAAIRAKVTAARMERAPPPAQAAIAQSARNYFDFALHAIAPPAPRLVAIGGLSGTGKSRLARDLAPLVVPMPGAVVVRSDVERKALFGVAETAKLPQQAYTGEVTARVYARLFEKARRILAAGHSAILDAVFAQAAERAHFVEAAKAAQVEPRGLFLTADLATRLARLGTRTHDASDADAAVARAQESFALGALDWTPIDASGTPAETLARARLPLG